MASHIHWEPCAGWMAFPFLTMGYGLLTCSFSIGYRVTDNGGEPWTQRFNRFKNSDVSALYGGAELLVGAVPVLMRELRLDMRDTIFLTALSSGETTATANRPLPLIAKWCAEASGSSFALDALSKNAHNPIHNFFTQPERDAELEKANYHSTHLGKTNIFVFDDFVTRGATQSKIAEAVLHANPGSRVYAVALCKADRQAFCSNPANDHLPGRWGELWEQGEQRYRDEQAKGTT